jgi:hypothetical protein
MHLFQWFFIYSFRACLKSQIRLDNKAEMGLR